MLQRKGSHWDLLLSLLGTSLKVYAASLPGATHAYVHQTKGHTVQLLSLLEVSSCASTALGTAHWHWHPLILSVATWAASCDRSSSKWGVTQAGKRQEQRGGWTPLRVVFASRRNDEFTVRLSDGLAGWTYFTAWRFSSCMSIRCLKQQSCIEISILDGTESCTQMQAVAKPVPDASIISTWKELTIRKQ